MHSKIVPEIVNIEPSEKGNRIKSLWKLFQSFESFTKVTIVTCLLIILATPFIVGNRQVFTPKAQEQSICPSLPQENIGEKPNKERAQFVAGLLDGKTRELSETILEYKAVPGSEKGQFTGQLLKLVKERKLLLIETMRKNPDAAFFSTLPSQEREPFLALNPGCVEKLVTLEGALEVMHADFFEEGTSNTRYTLKTLNGESIVLHPARGLKDPLESRTKVRVRGLRIDDDLVFDGTSSLSQPVIGESGIDVLSQPGNPPVLGEQKTVFILANFQDTPLPSFTNEMAKDTFIRLSNFYTENSYNKINITGDVFGWYTIPINKTCDGGLIRNKAIQAADPDVFFPNYSRLILFSPLCVGGSTGVGKTNVSTDDGIVSMSISWVSANSNSIDFVTAHELGHSFGNAHANFLNCGNVSLTPYAPTDCSGVEYGDIYDVMGAPYKMRHFNALHKEDMGWFDGNNIQTITANGTYTIEPLESNTGGLKTIKIQRSVSNYLYAEYRQPVGFDAGFTGTDIYDGASFHINLSGVLNPYLIDATPPGENTTPVLKQGMTFTDPATAAKISVTGQTANALTVNVTLGKTDFTPPAVSIASPTPGSTVLGTITISANTSDPSGIQKVEFWKAGITPKLLGTDFYAPYSISWNTASEPNDGIVYLEARAYDRKGEPFGASNNVGSSVQVVVIVSNPVVPTPTPIPPTPTPTPTITPTPTLGPKYVFVTSQTFNSNLKSYFGSVDGLTGGDSLCQYFADLSSVTVVKNKKWKAWLSTNSPVVNAKDRITDGKYIRVDGALIANNKADLTDRSIANPININEKKTLTSGGVWTGTRETGTTSSANCLGWTTTTNGGFGLAGQSSKADGTWSSSSYGNCTTDTLSLYCFQQ